MNAWDKAQLNVLFFKLQDTRLCVELHNINKILPLMQLESLPESPSYVAGLLNIEGKPIPVIDLALRLGLTPKPYTIETPILLCTHNNFDAGFIIGKVLGLDTIEENSIQLFENFNQQHSPFLASIIQHNALSLLLNMDYLLPIK